MPRVSKVKTTPPTIRQRAKEPEGGLIDPSEAAILIGEGEALLTGAPEPSVQTSTGSVGISTGIVDMRDVPLHEPVVQGRAAPTPLVTFHLRRVENELTDTMRTVHIPSPASIQPGERVVIHVYREE